MTKPGNDASQWTGALDRPETWDEFDALPRGVKRVYWDAPYRYTAIIAVRALRNGLDLRHIAFLLKENHGSDIAREALALYGPAHPQATAQ